MSKLQATDKGTRTFKYVYIPCDADKPLTEKTAVVYSDSRGAGDQLMNLLKVNFAEGTIDVESLKKAHASTHLNSQGGGEALNVISPETISKSGGSVEHFRLADGVSLYLDAVSALKSLPSNTRAIQLASQCGYGEVPLFGDMYVGRVDPYKKVNQDFLVEEARPDAGWLKEAMSQNM